MQESQPLPALAFYAGRVILAPEIVVITDRNDLDDQLFGTFARCRDLSPTTKNSRLATSSSSDAIAVPRLAQKSCRTRPTMLFQVNRTG